MTIFLESPHRGKKEKGRFHKVHNCEWLFKNDARRNSGASFGCRFESSFGPCTIYSPERERESTRLVPGEMQWWAIALSLLLFLSCLFIPGNPCRRYYDLSFYNHDRDLGDLTRFQETYDRDSKHEVIGTLGIPKRSR